LPPRPNPHSQVVSLVNQDITKVVELLKQGTGFMEDPISPRTQSRRDALANAPESVRSLLDQGHTQEFVARLARLMQKE
jgi:hypothetical protein